MLRMRSKTQNGQTQINSQLSQLALDERATNTRCEPQYFVKTGVQTKPLAIGLYWRAPTSASVGVKILPPLRKDLPADVGIPERELRQYQGYLEQYSKLDVPWTSDEEAAVRWILKQQPDFFERSLPFIGYIEFLFDAPFYEG